MALNSKSYAVMPVFPFARVCARAEAATNTAAVAVARNVRRCMAVLPIPVSTIALLCPRIAVVVITAHFPEAGLVLGGELQLAEPLRTLPEIELGQHKADRPTVLAADRPALPTRGEQHVVTGECLERHVGRVAVVAVLNDKARLGLGPDQLEQMTRRHTLPGVVEARPGSHAMDVRHYGRLRLGTKVVP